MKYKLLKKKEHFNGWEYVTLNENNEYVVAIDYEDNFFGEIKNKGTMHIDFFSEGIVFTTTEIYTEIGYLEVNPENKTKEYIKQELKNQFPEIFIWTRKFTKQQNFSKCSST